jgi:hypothetical protein
MSSLEVKIQPRNNIKDREDIRNVQAAQEYIESAMTRVGAVGNWLARPDKRITWKDQRRRFMAKSVSQERKQIRCRVRPGDNGSCWEFEVLAPQGIEPFELHRVFIALQQVKMDEAIDQSPVRPPKLEAPLPPLDLPKQFIPVDDGTPTLRPCNQCGKDVDVGFQNRHYEWAEARIYCDCLQEKHGMEEKLTSVVSRVEDDANYNRIMRERFNGHDQEVRKEPHLPEITDDAAVGLTSRLAVIVQRIKKRQDQKAQLLERKADLEEQFETLTKDLGEVDECLKFIAAEETQDDEAKAAKQMLAIFQGGL